MSVIVLGMEMPTACEFCGFCRLYRENGRVWCNAKNRILCQKWENPDFTELRIDVPDWCPLCPLPERHGRLIDADEATRGSLKRTGKRLLAIDTAPTIVEAEGD